MSKVYRPEGRYQLTSHAAAILIVMIIFVSVSYYFFLARPDEQAQTSDALTALDAAKPAGRRTGRPCFVTSWTDSATAPTRTAGLTL